MTDSNDFQESRVHPAVPFIRPLYRGMGEAVANRTVFRDSDNKKWDNVAARVAEGNTGLVANGEQDYVPLRDAIAAGRVLLSGRHLQHGDKQQGSRNLEVFSNCSTAAASFILFYLLLNGSGVGRDYSDAMMAVDWNNAPNLILACDSQHPDFDGSVFTDPVEVKAELKTSRQNHRWFIVPDSREGWAQAAEIYETMAFERCSNETLVLDFSLVREKGQPIGGMQNRPASGPVPTAAAFKQIAELKGKNYPRWKQAMFVDHYLAECVVVGGARRSARMSTKYWADPDAIDFAHIKSEHGLWSSNNSIIATAEFYEQAKIAGTHASDVFKAMTHAAYHHGTGEPGVINVHNFAPDNIDWSLYEDGNYVGSFKYTVADGTKPYLKALVDNVKLMKYKSIVNPCSEISLNILGGYCVIADVVPYFADNLDQAEESFRLAARALIRVNTMDSLYSREVERTNRIGVGFTGLHEFAWKFFGLGFRDILDEEKASSFWKTMSRFSRAVKQEAAKYAQELGVNVPATDTTVKPAGTTSKLFGLTEGAHLPSMKEYLRWVQYRTDANADQIESFSSKGYPTRELKTYAGTTIVGFPTQPLICKLGMSDKLITASEATPEEQYKYLSLLEKYWIRGTDESGNPLEKDTGNQISYTLKYDPAKVSYEKFAEMMMNHQSQIRCCAVMPMVDVTAYEYQPEEPFTSAKHFMQVIGNITDLEMLEDIDMEHLSCSNGACPI